MSILQQADSLINGERQQSYGHPALNLNLIACQWTNYLRSRHPYIDAGIAEGDVCISAEDVCWMMALLKMCRQMHRKNPENLIDAAGYIGLIEKLQGAKTHE